MTAKGAIEKVRIFYRRYRRMPSYQEMCKLFGYKSKQGVARLVEKMIKTNLLEKDAKGFLTIKNALLSLPLLGSIRTEHPQHEKKRLIEAHTFDDYLVDRPESSCLLKVTGDSMEQAGINKGDIVIVDKSRRPKENDIVVANIEEEFTLKYLQKIKGKYFLVGANPKYDDIYPKQSLTIEGVVVSLVRKYR